MTDARSSQRRLQGGLRAALVACALGAGVLLAGPAPRAAAATPAAAPPTPAAAFALSTPGGLSRWATVERRTRAHTRPSAVSPVVTTLSTRTPERTAGIVLTLERVEVDARLWVRVRLPVLPNNSTGWVPRDALGVYHPVRTHLIVDTHRFVARLKRNGRTVLRVRVGVGQRRWPTPTGRFFVRNRLKGFGDPSYGPLAFGTSGRSAVLTDWPGGGFIGIHGTDRPELIPGRISHGCIRLRNRDVRRLGRLMPVGTPITIR